MSAYRTLNQTVLAKVEATPGDDALPDVATDAVLVENPLRNPDLGIVETNEVTGALDDRGPIPAGGFSPFTADVWIKGSGTPGAAPEYGPFLRGCAMGESLLIAPITAEAVGGTADTIELMAGDGANVEIGMTIELNSGVGSGQVRVVTGKAGDIISVFPDWETPPVATTGYMIDANALYVPISENLETLTIYRYRHRSDGGDSKLDRILGAAGTWTLNMPVREPGRLSFDYRGQLVSPTDVTPPGAATFDDVRPFPYLQAETYLGQTPIKLNTLALDYGSEVQLIDNPAQEFGYDAAGITRRRVAGRFNPPLELQSARDAFDSWLNGTTQEFWAMWGTRAGNRVSVYIPSVRYTGVEEEDVSGFAHEGLPFRALGENSGLYLAIS